MRLPFRRRDGGCELHVLLQVRAVTVGRGGRGGGGHSGRAGGAPEAAAAAAWRLALSRDPLQAAAGVRRVDGALDGCGEETELKAS